MRYFLGLMIILIAVSPGPLMAADAGPQESVRQYMEDFQYQRTLYSFLDGDYLSFPELRYGPSNTSLKNRALILQRVSDIRMQNKRGYTEFSEPLSVETPFQISLLDAYYNVKDYDETLALSRVFDSGAARYFEGISLFRLNRMKDAKLPLTQVPTDTRFYPYARMTLAQIAVTDKNLQEAEGYLKELLLSPYIKSEGIGEAVHLFLGQLLFEKGSFQEAVKEFSQVPPESPLYREATIGNAWGSLRLGDYRKTIDLLKGIDVDYPYDPLEKEALIILGYCYIEGGMLSQARDHYRELLNTLSVNEERLEQIIGDNSISQRYVSLLLKQGPLFLTDEERHYLSIFEDDQVVSSLLKEYGTLRMLKKGFFGKEAEASKKEAYLENRISGLTERIREIEEYVNKSKPILQEVRKRGRQRIHAERERFGIDLVYFADMLCNYWQEILGRRVSGEAKQLVLLIMQDWVEAGSPPCRGPLFICHILSFADPMAYLKETPEQIHEIVGSIEAIGNDLTRMRKGERIRFESMLPEVREKAIKKMGEDRKALKRLRKIREEANSNLKEAERGSGETLATLERYITERFIKAKYELTDFKANITAGLDVPRK